MTQALITAAPLSLDENRQLLEGLLTGFCQRSAPIVSREDAQAGISSTETFRKVAWLARQVHLYAFRELSTSMLVPPQVSPPNARSNRLVIPAAQFGQYCLELSKLEKFWAYKEALEGHARQVLQNIRAYDPKMPNDLEGVVAQAALTLCADRARIMGAPLASLPVEIIAHISENL